MVARGTDCPALQNNAPWHCAKTGRHSSNVDESPDFIDSQLTYYSARLGLLRSQGSGLASKISLLAARRIITRVFKLHTCCAGDPVVVVLGLNFEHRAAV